MHQQASGFAIVGVASIVALRMARGKVSRVRIGVTGVLRFPYRASTRRKRCSEKVPMRMRLAEASGARR